MRMVIHETVRINLDAVFFFIFQEQVIIELLGPVPLEEPIFVVALPSHVKE